MTEHRTWGIRRSDLLRADPRDAKLFLACAKVSNELNISTKLHWYARNGFFGTNIENMPEYAGQLSFFSYFISILAGHAYEAYNLLKSSNFQRLLIHSDLRQHLLFSLAYDEICVYFEKPDNMIQTLRNSVSFHTDTRFLYNTLNKTPKDFIFVMINGEYLGHNVSRGSDDLIMQAMIGPEKTDHEADDAIYQNTSAKILAITDSMGVVFSNFLSYLAIQKFGLSADALFSLPSTVDGPPIDKVYLPYFCSHPLEGTRT